MPTFTFNGFDGEGRPARGARSCASGEAMEEYLARAGVSGYTVYASATKYSPRAYTHVSPMELSVFCREMSCVFFSHVTVMEGLLTLSDQTGSRQLRQALREAHSHMRGGMTFAAAAGMYPHVFTPYLANMVAIGEDSGTLDTVFEKMADYFEKEHKTRRRLRSAVAYPLTLSVLMAAIVVLMVIKIIPMFESTLLSMGGEMPSATKTIFHVSAFLAKNIWIIAAAIALIAAALARFVKTAGGRMWLDRRKMTFPLSGYVLSRILTARLARSLAILLKSGVQLLNALEEALGLADNRYIESRLAAACARVREGAELSAVLRGLGLFPPLFLNLVTIGEATGRLDDMLERAAGIFDNEANEAVERLTVMIEPALIIVLSVIVGIILMSVMLPMISVMNAIM